MSRETYSRLIRRIKSRSVHFHYTIIWPLRLYYLLLSFTAEGNLGKSTYDRTGHTNRTSVFSRNWTSWKLAVIMVRLARLTHRCLGQHPWLKSCDFSVWPFAVSVSVCRVSKDGAHGVEHVQTRSSQAVAARSCRKILSWIAARLAWEWHGPWKIAPRACDEFFFLCRRWLWRAQQLCQHRKKKGKLNAPLIGINWALIGKLFR